MGVYSTEKDTDTAGMTPFDFEVQGDINKSRQHLR